MVHGGCQPPVPVLFFTARLKGFHTQPLPFLRTDQTFIFLLTGQAPPPVLAASSPALGQGSAHGGPGLMDRTTQVCHPWLRLRAAPVQANVWAGLYHQWWWQGPTASVDSNPAGLDQGRQLFPFHRGCISGAEAPGERSWRCPCFPAPLTGLTPPIPST